MVRLPRDHRPSQSTSLDYSSPIGGRGHIGAHAVALVPLRELRDKILVVGGAVDDVQPRIGSRVQEPHLPIELLGCSRSSAPELHPRRGWSFTVPRGGEETVVGLLPGLRRPRIAPHFGRVELATSEPGLEAQTLLCDRPRSIRHRTANLPRFVVPPCSLRVSVYTSAATSNGRDRCGNPFPL